MKPPIPFPHPSLSLGTDILHIPRLQALLSKSSSRYLSPFVHRILTPYERSSSAYQSKLSAYLSRSTIANGLKKGGDGEVDPFARWLGGRWAAKESAFKALYSSDVEQGLNEGRGRRWGWHDIEVHTKSLYPRPPAGPEVGETKVEAGEEGEAADGHTGAPYLVIYDPWDSSSHTIGFGELAGQGDAKPGAARERQGRVARVSISHDGEYATAVALVAY